MAKIIELIVTEKNIGKGIEGDPHRNILELYTKDGKLIGEAGYENDGDVTFLDRETLRDIYKS